MDKITRYEVRLSGAGGQGLVTAGMILAYAAILDGKNAVQTQVYGPESRGGACRSEVILSDVEIDYPQVTFPDLCLVMSQESYDRFGDDIKPGGTLIVDNTLIEEKDDLGDIRVFSSPITEITKRELGKTIVANMVALTVLNEVVELVDPESLLKAILTRVPDKYADLNKDAFELGKKIAKNFPSMRITC
jgi:2-oxoglutarate ferredoxin oxidoreductase subunit gamma